MLSNTSKEELQDKIAKLEETLLLKDKQISDLQSENNDLRKKIKETELAADGLYKNLKSRVPKTKVIDDSEDFSIQMCPFCINRAPYMPPTGERCWTLTANMQAWLNLDQTAFEDALPRLSIETEPPESLNTLNNPQKRCCSYLKTYRDLYGYGGPRVFFPECIIARIRQEWPKNFDGAEYDQIQEDNENQNVDEPSENEEEDLDTDEEFLEGF